MWGTLDDLYTHNLYLAIVDRIASKLVLCLVHYSAHSTQHPKWSAKEELLSIPVSFFASYCLSTEELLSV